MWPDRVSNPGPLTYESGVLPIALRGPAALLVNVTINVTIKTYGSVQYYYTYGHFMSCVFSCSHVLYVSF